MPIEVEVLGALASRAALLARRVGKIQDRTEQAFSASLVILSLLATGVGSVAVVMTIQGEVEGSASFWLTIAGMVGTVAAVVLGFLTMRESERESRALAERAALMRQIRITLLQDGAPKTEIFTESEAELEALISLINELETQRRASAEQSSHSENPLASGPGKGDAE